MIDINSYLNVGNTRNKMFTQAVPLFPSALFTYQMTREVNKKELDFILKQETDGTKKNLSNRIGLDNNILNAKPLKEIKKQIEECLLHYVHAFADASSNIEPVLICSWLNYTKLNQNHHRHGHPNSLISGTLYVNVDENTDSIVFFKNKSVGHGFDSYSFDKPAMNNMWNANRFPVKVNNGLIVLFPSYLDHFVPPVQTNHTRISLAFNAFIKGEVSTQVGMSLSLP